MTEQRCGTCLKWEFTDSTQIGGEIQHWGVCEELYRCERRRSSRSDESCRRASTTRHDSGSLCIFYQRKESDEHNSEGTD